VQDIRTGEKAIVAPQRQDASLNFIGRIRTPWQERRECPRQGTFDGPRCRIEIDDIWGEALDGIETCERLQVLYWLHESRRDLVSQMPAGRAEAVGTFALRSPARPNPIGVSVVALIGREGTTLLVRGLDCLDGTPLIDLKPERCAFSADKESEK